MANENIIKRKSVEIELTDGRKVKLSPLPVNDLIDLSPIIAKLEKAKDGEISVGILIDLRKLAYVVLSKQIDDLTEEKAGSLIDMIDVQSILAIIVGQKKL